MDAQLVRLMPENVKQVQQWIYDNGGLSVKRGSGDGLVVNTDAALVHAKFGDYVARDVNTGEWRIISDYC
ncbi:hypothetical protein CJ179_38925 [Rhodococcus sp. ACS1]|uniref:hypothetical protein n=1 Tax=Rhodococcus sp. ACS1 TaxID=2028570 RepID=UPI000BB10733|nr:hypothetical protein [Rhodococcus sp. ACS1]PBC38571.1 hypothetical protein CJ179_38925 [Rhodococcus sp. ACS1]